MGILGQGKGAWPLARRLSECTASHRCILCPSPPPIHPPLHPFLHRALLMRPTFPKKRGQVPACMGTAPCMATSDVCVWCTTLAGMCAAESMSALGGSACWRRGTAHTQTMHKLGSPRPP